MPGSDCQTSGLSLVSSLPHSQLPHPLSYMHTPRSDVPWGKAHKHALVSPDTGAQGHRPSPPWLDSSCCSQTHTHRDTLTHIHIHAHRTWLLTQESNQKCNLTRKSQPDQTSIMTCSLFPCNCLFLSTYLCIFHACSFESSLHPPVLAFGLYP